jgi:hypothetical protein
MGAPFLFANAVHRLTFAFCEPVFGRKAVASKYEAGLSCYMSQRELAGSSLYIIYC